MGMRFYIHVPNSPRDKNKMSHNPSLVKKSCFFGLQNSESCPHWHMEKNFFINFKLYDLANGKE
jgi:hypothetical protein